MEIGRKSYILDPRYHALESVGSVPFRIWEDIDPQVRMFRTHPKDPEHSAVSSFPVQCWVNPTRASLWFGFMPSRGEEIAALMGIDPSELPVYLQHWKKDQHQGNQLQDRIDPVASETKNPWDKMTFSVVVGLSKRAYKKISAARVKT